MIETKTHIFNVTYLGQGIYDTVQEDAQVGLLDRPQVASIFKEFSDAVKAETIEPEDLLPQFVSYLGKNIIPGWLAFTVRNILATNSISAEPFYISGLLINAIARGYIERPDGSFKSRPCVPLRNKDAQAVIERIFREIDEAKLAFIETLDDIEDDEPIEYLNGFDTKPGADLKTTGITKAQYYWDKKDRLAFNIPEWFLTTSSRTSEDCDPLNSVVETKKGHCPICGNKLVKQEGQKRKPRYCSDNCRKEARKATFVKATKEKRRTNDYVRQTGVVPDRYEPFIRYLVKAWVGSYTANKNKVSLLNKENIYDLVRTENEKKPKGIKPENYQREACECGHEDLEVYKPWNEDGGKIGSKVLYCKNCGLVHDYGIQSTPQKPNSGYLGD